MADKREINTGGPAFPQSDLSAYGMGPDQTCNGGMTLRDWFAGQAAAGFAACSEFDKPASVYADAAYKIADEMLKAREAKS